MPRLKAPSMTMKKWVKGYLEHGNAELAYRQATNGRTKESTIERQAGNYKKHPLVQEYMRGIMEKAGLTDEKIAEGLKKVFDAAVTEASLKQSNPAHALKALEMMAKLKDLYPAEKKKIEKKTLNLNLGNKSEGELLTMLDGLSKEIRNFKGMVKYTEKIKGGGIEDAEVV